MSDTRTTSSSSRGHEGGEDQHPSAYPTYRDGPVPPHEATTTKPTDVDLPVERRTYPWSAIVVVAIAAIIGIGLIVYGTSEVAQEEAPPLATEGPSETDSGAAVPEADSGGDAAAPQSEEEATDLLVPGSG